MVEKDIGRIKKGEYQGEVTEIVVGIREYKGKVGVDIREFASGSKYTGPTKKGLRIPAEAFHQFKELVNSVKQEDLVASGSEEAFTGNKQKVSEEEIEDY